MSLFLEKSNDSLGNTIFHLKGGLDFASSLKLRQEIAKLLKEKNATYLILNMDSLDFVGSSAIGHFIETINFFNRESIKIKMIHIKDEFKKTFTLYDIVHQEKVIEEAA